jgi:hypothetical protein
MSPTGENLDNLMAWRALALQQLPYQASMLLSLRVLDAPGLGTFAVDPFHRLYIDLEAVTPKGRAGARRPSCTSADTCSATTPGEPLT